MHISVMTIKRVLAGVSAIYLVVSFMIFLVSFLIPQAEIRGILRSLFALLTFPSLGLLPLSMVLRQWRLVLLLLPILFAWGLIYGTLLVPRTGSASESEFRFTVLTFNIQIATENLDSLGMMIRNADADIVALQELSEPAAQSLSQTLAAVYPYQALYPQENPHWGQGVLSRFPLSESEYWRNEEIEVAQGHMWAQVEIDGRVITIFSTHPVPPFSFEKGITLQAHSREISILLERVAQHDTPLLLMGDFNMTQLMDEYRQTTRLYVDTFREAGRSGFGFSFPAGNRLPLPPIVRLDYIFHSAHFRGLDAHPLPRSGVSDHLPFWAELVFIE